MKMCLTELKGYFPPLHLLCLLALATSCLPTPPLTGWPYSCVWNSPTITCTKAHGIPFNLSGYLIVQNSGDQFDGDKIVIFYGIGKFPKINHATGKRINGGIPQLGNLTNHLEVVESDITTTLPDPNFSGLAVIDFEDWRPLFKHNFDSLDIYQKASEDLVRQQHPDWNSSQVREEAEEQFNTAARNYFQDTLEVARRLRPQAYWGYYGFPRCYGKPGNYCLSGSQADNDRLWWLWEASTALYPRIYLGESALLHVLYPGFTSVSQLSCMRSTPGYTYPHSLR